MLPEERLVKVLGIAERRPLTVVLWHEKLLRARRPLTITRRQAFWPKRRLNNVYFHWPTTTIHIHFSWRSAEDFNDFSR
jgi:hypothetical protein